MWKQSQLGSPQAHPDQHLGEEEPPEAIPYVRHAAAFLVLQQQVVALADETPSAFAA